MSDDLVKRLRDKYTSPQDVAEAADRIEQLEAVLEKISKERTLWGAMRKADHALGRFESKALEGKDE